MLNLALIAIWLLLSLVSLCLGQYHVSIDEAIKILLGSDADATARSVMYDIRILACS